MLPEPPPLSSADQARIGPWFLALARLPERRPDLRFLVGRAEERVMRSTGCTGYELYASASHRGKPGRLGVIGRWVDYYLDVERRARGGGGAPPAPSPQG